MTAAVLFTVALVGALVIRPHDWRPALDAWLLALGGVVLAAAVAATRTALPEPNRLPFDPARRKRQPEEEQLPQLARVEREVTMSVGMAFDAHYRLRPLLREIAAHRLSSRRGLMLDSGSAAVQEALGEPLWELVRPEREPPRFQHDPGMPARELRAAVEALERI